MAQKDFNTIIGQIEKDLKNLQSAREQVESMIASNTKFADATSDLVKKTQSLVAEIKTATEGAVRKFTEKLTVSENAVNKVVTESINRIESNVKKIEEANLKLQELTQAKVNELSNLATKSIEEQRLENLKTLNQILETHNQIRRLMGQLLALNLPNTLMRMNGNLEDLQQQNNQQFSAIKTIQITTLVVTGIFGIVIILKLFGII
ncbi:MAG: hypothetical protein LBC89_01420 [Bacteroidales bacterium]|jgi:uncharacterized protein YicC (UPF0701 family)|nr:hypothetical protein [Bacteroidales bacterium]